MFSQFNKRPIDGSSNASKRHNSGNKPSSLPSNKRRNSSAVSSPKGKPAMRQKTLSSFFFQARGPEAKSSAAASSSGSKTELAADKFKGFSSRKPLLQRRPTFESCGSFEDEDPDVEIRRLENERPLNNFKTLSRSSSTLTAVSATSKELGRSTSSLSPFFSHHEKSFSGNSTTLTYEEDVLATSTQTSTASFSSSQRSSKRSSQLSFPIISSKKLKPIRAPVSNVLRQNVTKTSLELTNEQKAVIDLIVNKRLNVFYTGSAGTGKSVVLREIVGQLKSRYGESAVAVTASTGLAAVNVGGSTVNRFSGIGIGKGAAEKLAAQVKRNKASAERWKRAKILIVDEVSMIDGRFLDKMDYVARRVRNVLDRPFGGIQLVLTGDFFQLPPVPDRDPGVSKPIFCFESKVWREAIQKTICLTQVFRQQDNELVDILNSIRFGEIKPDTSLKIKALAREVDYSDGIEPTELYPTRREVEVSNKRRLERLRGEVVEFLSEDLYKASDQKHVKLLESLMAEKTLILKEEAQVMMIKNVDETLVNGSLGKVLFFTTEPLYQKMRELYPATELSNSELVLDMRLICKCIGVPESAYTADIRQDINSRPLARHDILKLMLNIAAKESEKEKYPLIQFSTRTGFRYELITPHDFIVDIPNEETSVSRRQLPLLLCWALSIHKAQGQTIDRLKVDLRKIFEAGQVYVALSRAVSKDRLQIVNFDPKKIRANETVKTFYGTLETINSASG